MTTIIWQQLNFRTTFTLNFFDMKISFHGAAHCVTGSKHLITLKNNKKILVIRLKQVIQIYQKREQPLSLLQEIATAAVDAGPPPLSLELSASTFLGVLGISVSS